MANRVGGLAIRARSKAAARHYVLVRLWSYALQFVAQNFSLDA